MLMYNLPNGILLVPDCLRASLRCRTVLAYGDDIIIIIINHLPVHKFSCAVRHISELDFRSICSDYEDCPFLWCGVRQLPISCWSFGATVSLSRAFFVIFRNNVSENSLLFCFSWISSVPLKCLLQFYCMFHSLACKAAVPKQAWIVEIWTGGRLLVRSVELQWSRECKVAVSVLQLFAVTYCTEGCPLTGCNTWTGTQLALCDIAHPPKLNYVNGNPKLNFCQLSGWGVDCDTVLLYKWDGVPPFLAEVPPFWTEVPPFGQSFHPFGQRFHRFWQRFHHFGQRFHPFGQRFHPFGQRFHPFGQRFRPFGQSFHPLDRGSTLFGRGSTLLAEVPLFWTEVPPFGQRFHPFGQRFHPFGQRFHPFGQRFPNGATGSFSKYVVTLQNC
jgi:hypothetical protein